MVVAGGMVVGYDYHHPPEEEWMTEILDHVREEMKRRGIDPSQPLTDDQRVQVDLILYGTAFVYKGQRIDPRHVEVYRDDGHDVTRTWPSLGIGRMTNADRGARASKEQGPR